MRHVLIEKDAGSAQRPLTAFVLFFAALLAACSTGAPVDAGNPADAGGPVTVAKAARRTLQRTVTIPSELVPFQEIDVFAKEAGYVRELHVDYGTRVKKGQLMAVLEIPELQAVLRQDEEAITAASHEVERLQQVFKRNQAEHHVVHLQHERLRRVSETQPGLIPQQQVDDASGRDLASEARLEAAASSIQAAESQLAAARANLAQHQAIFAYARIAAPFNGVVTKRYANLGALMQRATDSSTGLLPLVRLAQDDVLRLTIPVPERYVQYIRMGAPVVVRVPSLNQSFPGKIARSALKVSQDTRTMHTEVDVRNPNSILVPGLYAEAVLTLEERDNVLVIPLDAVEHADTEPVVRIADPKHPGEVRMVELGAQTADYVEVRSGLKEGEPVMVTAGDGSGASRRQATRGWTITH